MFTVGLDDYLTSLIQFKDSYLIVDLQLLFDWFSIKNESISNTIINLPVTIDVPNFSIDEIKQIGLGSLLREAGDAKLEFLGLNTRFGFIASEKFEEYFVYMFSILAPFCSTTFAAKRKKIFVS